MTVIYELLPHTTIPCKTWLESRVEGDVAVSELSDRDGNLIQRFELDQRPGHGDEHEWMRQAQHESIQLWNQIEDEKLGKQRRQEQGQALLAAFEDESVLDALVERVASRLAAQQTE